jgi:hypothetical protein
MTAETNKIVMHRFLEFINTASEMLAQELISPDAIFHVPGRPWPMRGPAGYLAIIRMMRGGFPDIQWTLWTGTVNAGRLSVRVLSAPLKICKFSPDTEWPTPLRASVADCFWPILE